MLTQQEANELMEMLKKLENNNNIEFPKSGSYKILELNSLSGDEKFVIDINRKGRINVSKCTYQNRYRKDIILVRLDIDGQPHTNPDGTVLSGYHFHTYTEGYDDRWAYEIPSDIFTDTTDLLSTLKEFLNYCKVINIPEIYGQGDGLL